MTPTETPSLVLAHLSDVHLPPPAPLPSWPHFTNKRALSVASWKRHRVHHHLPALSDAVRDDMQAARPDLILNTGDLTNFGLREEFSNAASWLGTMKAPCLVVPGNHDAMVREPWQETTAQWSDWMENSAEGAFPYLREEGDLAIIGVNSAVPTPPFMACGHVGAAQRARLATRPMPRHHDPSSPTRWPRALAQIAARSQGCRRHHCATRCCHGAAWPFT